MPCTAKALKEKSNAVSLIKDMYSCEYCAEQNNFSVMENAVFS